MLDKYFVISPPINARYFSQIVVRLPSSCKDTAIGILLGMFPDTVMLRVNYFNGTSTTLLGYDWNKNKYIMQLIKLQKKRLTLQARGIYPVGSFKDLLT